MRHLTDKNKYIDFDDLLYEEETEDERLERFAEKARRWQSEHPNTYANSKRYLNPPHPQDFSR